MRTIDRGLNKIFGSLDFKWVKTSFVISKLDLSSFTNQITQRQSKYLIESFIKLYLFKRIKGITTYPDLIKKLNKDDIINLGLTEGFPKKRTFNEFFQKKLTNEQRESLNNIVEKILSCATKNNIILDIELVKETIVKKRKEVNKKNKAFKEAVKLVKKLVYPQIKIKMRHNAKFTTKDLLDVLVHVAQTNDFCNNGVKTFSELNPEIDAPSRETIQYHFRKLNKKDKIEEIFRNIFDVIFEFSKRNYNILNRRKLDLAIDVHDVPYYGSKTDPYVLGGKHYRGTNHFFKFITCSIVINGRRFCIDTLMIHPLDSLESLVNKLIKRAKEKIRIDKVYLDRGFDKPKIITVLKENNVKYLMPKIKSSTVKQWFDKLEDCNSRFVKDFKIGNETTNLVLVNDKDGIKRAFSTNLYIPEQLSHYLFNFYSKRWGIETKYRQLEHSFKAKTTSKNFHVRLFYFLFSVCLFNLWVLINICVSIKIYGRVIDTPIITSKLFAVVLYKVQIDPGG